MILCPEISHHTQKVVGSHVRRNGKQPVIGAFRGWIRSFRIFCWSMFVLHWRVIVSRKSAVWAASSYSSSLSWSHGLPVAAVLPGGGTGGNWRFRVGSTTTSDRHSGNEMDEKERDHPVTPVIGRRLVESIQRESRVRGDGLRVPYNQSIIPTDREFDPNDDDSTSSTIPSTERSEPVSRPKKTRDFSLRVRHSLADLFSGLGFVASSTVSLVFDRQQFQRLRPTVEAFRKFLRMSGIDGELSPSLNSRLLSNLIILGRIQAMQWQDGDRRDLVRSTNQGWTLPTKEEIRRFMRYATAAYGASMIQAVEMGVAGRFGDSLIKTTRRSISDHIGVPEEHIILMDVDYDGSGSHLRHFVAVDHENKKVVLAIRGTFSLSEIIVDVAAFSRPFCGGEAHSEMAAMAERVWMAAGKTILGLLADNKEYELILTGHSLGAGTASLLNILCHRNQRELVGGRPVRCFAYASPPVFTPIFFVRDAASSCINLIHHRDFVPFLSISAVRRLFAGIRAIEDENLSLIQRMQLVTGIRSPSSSLCDNVRRAAVAKLPPKMGAPILEIPAAANLWLYPTDDTGSSYDFKLCNSLKLSELGLFVDSNMLQDHFPLRYEHAIENLG